MLRGIYPLRDCSDHELANRTRPCLKYQIKLCSAPCVDYVSQEQYREDLEGAVAVLKGQTGAVLERLKAAMLQASNDLEYERAAQYRDRIAFLQNSTETQSVEMDRFLDRDVFGWYRRGPRVEVVVLLFRSGKLLSANPFSLTPSSFRTTKRCPCSCRSTIKPDARSRTRFPCPSQLTVRKRWPSG